MIVKLNNTLIAVNYHIQLLLFKDFVNNIGNLTY
jgi:hypothetical protein